VIVCRICGEEENPERARFCLACGAELTVTSAADSARQETVTMLFSDVVGSTMLGERLDPEVLSHVMSSYYAAMKPVVEDHGGVVIKFIGDALVASFADGLAACRAAVAMRERLADVNAELERTRGVQIGARTGIHTGPVAVSGPGGRTVVPGDTGNVAAALQSAAEPGQILLGQSTYALVDGSVDVEAAGDVALKGKAATAHAYLLGGA
jgi:class 3 adenylate cyclase